jgi:sugar phosphate permease
VNIHKDATGFVIAAGAILGLCAGLLWTAQGSLMLAYPTEDQKGKFIGIFWSIFNLGGVVGAAVSLGRNFHSEVCFTLISTCPPLTRPAVRQANRGEQLIMY